MSENNNVMMTNYESIVKEAQRKKTFGQKFKKTYPAFIILLLLIGFSFFIKEFMTEKVQTDKNAAFDKAITSVMSRLENKNRVNLDILRQMSHIYKNYFIVRDVFELYGSIPTSTYHSLLSMDYVHKVTNNELGTFVFDARSQGYYDIKIYPEGQRDMYYIIEYFVPVEKNLHRSGYDIKTDPIFETAIEQAARNEMVVSTEFYNIRPDTLGFFYIAPTYKKDSVSQDEEDRMRLFNGAIVLEVEADMFFHEALGKGIASDTSIVFKVIDQTGDQNSNTVFESDNSEVLSGFTPSLTDKIEFSLADRKVMVEFFNTPNFTDPMQENLPLLTFILSLLLSLVLFGFILAMITGRARAVDLAERITRSQRRIVESTKDMIAVLDMNGVWRSMNPAIKEALDYEATDVIGTNINDYFAEDDYKKEFSHLLEHTEDEFTERNDIKMKTKTGDVKWINWSFTISKADGVIYCIGRDVTLEKLASEQAEIKNRQVMLAEQHTREASESKSFFMKQLSHQLRNSLTSIIGYLQLLSGKFYETEEERESYVDLAELSSEELFTYVMDITETISLNDNKDMPEVSTVKFSKVIENSKAELKKTLNNGKHIDVNLMEECKLPSVIADLNLLTHTFAELYQALSVKNLKTEVLVNIQENTYEGAAEIQLLGSANILVESIINIYKNNTNSVIEALKDDKEGIMLKLATAASNIRRLGGTMKVDTLGEDGNLVMIYMPLASSGSQLFQQQQPA